MTRPAAPPPPDLSEQPRTAAGQSLLRQWSGHVNEPEVRIVVLAIEAEASAAAVPLDVERLAYVIWMHADIALAIGRRDKTGARKVAEVLAAEYARLSADEEGGTT